MAMVMIRVRVRDTIRYDTEPTTKKCKTEKLKSKKDGYAQK